MELGATIPESSVDSRLATVLPGHCSTLIYTSGTIKCNKIRISTVLKIILQRRLVQCSTQQYSAITGDKSIYCIQYYFTLFYCILHDYISFSFTRALLVILILFYFILCNFIYFTLFCVNSSFQLSFIFISSYYYSYSISISISISVYGHYFSSQFYFILFYFILFCLNFSFNSFMCSSISHSFILFILLYSHYWSIIYSLISIILFMFYSLFQPLLVKLLYILLYHSLYYCINSHYFIYPRHYWSSTVLICFNML